MSWKQDGREREALQTSRRHTNMGSVKRQHVGHGEMEEIRDDENNHVGFPVSRLGLSPLQKNPAYSSAKKKKKSDASHELEEQVHGTRGPVPPTTMHCPKFTSYSLPSAPRPQRGPQAPARPPVGQDVSATYLGGKLLSFLLLHARPLKKRSRLPRRVWTM